MVPLQSIGNSCYFGGNALVCLLDQLTAAAGGPGLLGVMTGGVLFLTLYIAGNGSMATPTVAVILVGSALVPMVPGQYQQMAIAIVVIGLAAALWQILQQWVLSPGAST
jgi:hypothetical protein